MDSILKNTYLWAIVLELTKHYDFQLLDFPLEENKESLCENHPFEEKPILLIRNHGRKYELVRIQAVEYVWPSMLSRDIRQFVDHIPLLKRGLHASQLSVLNLYLFSAPPGERIDEVFSTMGYLEEHKCVIHSAGYSLSTLSMETHPLGVHRLGIDQEAFLMAVEQHVLTTPLWQLKQAVEEEEKRKEKEFKAVFHYGKPILTYVLLVTNVLMFFFLELVGSSTDVQTLITYGAKWNPSIIAGEYWRFVTPMFLHIGYLHITFNGLALYYLGSLVERIYGTWRFFWIYFLSGFIGVVASFAFTDNVAAGASGAIFGCFGAMLYFGLKRKDLFFRTLGYDIIFVLLFNLGIGVVIPMIDNYAHVGGLVGGFLAAMMVHLPRQCMVKERIGALSALVMLSLVLIQLGFNKGVDTPMYHIIQSELEMKRENWSQAGIHLEKAIQLGSQEPEVYLQLGMIYNQLEKFIEAEKMLEEAKSRGSDLAELYFHLAYAQLKLGKWEEGKHNLIKTIEKNPHLVEAYYNLALVYAEQNQRDKALEIIKEAKEKNVSSPLLDELQQKILDLP